MRVLALLAACLMVRSLDGAEGSSGKEPAACPAPVAGAPALVAPYLSSPNGASDTVIIDPRTNLMWEAKTDDGGPRDKDRIFNWEEAVKYCEEELDGAGVGGKPYAGFDDWRLPTVHELFGIVDHSTFQPAVSDAFHSPASGSYCQPAMYWSSTTPAADLTRACYVDFFDGFVLQDSQAFRLYVRAVRDNSALVPSDHAEAGARAAWTRLGSPAPGAPSECPSYRPAAAFDSHRGRLVVFGGRAATGNMLDKTWEWDGEKWTECSPQDPEGDGNPPPQMCHAMAYSPRDHLTYLVTAETVESPATDLWSWNGESWRLVLSGSSGGNVPPSRSCATLTCDEARDTLVLFGGTTKDGNLSADVWEFKGAAWEKASPEGARPAPRFLHAATYDPIRETVVIFGGLAASGGTRHLLGDTWEWDGEAWLQRKGTHPPERFCSQLAWCPARGTAILFGGWGEPTGVQHAPLGDVWQWNGTGWRSLPSVDAEPGPMRAHVLVREPGGNGLLLVGGYLGGGLVDPDAYNPFCWRLELQPDTPQQ